MPADEWKGSTFPTNFHPLLVATPLSVEAEPHKIGGNLTERQSLSAHQVAQPHNIVSIFKDYNYYKDFLPPQK